MRALSVKQPYAEEIAAGEKKREYRTWKAGAVVGGDLLIVASRSPGEGYAGEAQGVAICVVHVTKISGAPGDYAWHLSNPRRVDPEPIKGYAALFHVADERIRIVTSRSTSAAPAKLKASGRAKAGPYSFTVGDNAIRGESAPNDKEAFQKALELAQARGRDVTILRDGFAIRIVDPTETLPAERA